jgi:hypothetical protein
MTLDMPAILVTVVLTVIATKALDRVSAPVTARLAKASDAWSARNTSREAERNAKARGYLEHPELLTHHLLRAVIYVATMVALISFLFGALIFVVLVQPTLSPEERTSASSMALIQLGGIVVTTFGLITSLNRYTDVESLYRRVERLRQSNTSKDADTPTT